MSRSPANCCVDGSWKADGTSDSVCSAILPPKEILAELAAEMRLDVEEVPLAEFVPLPPQAHERRRPVGRYGQLDVCIFDLYSIALSKIARGFEAGLEDVLFLLHEGLRVRRAGAPLQRHLA